MGHQIGFYMMPEDTIVIQDLLQKLEPMKILHARSPSQTPRTVDSLDVIEDGKPWLILYFAREEDLPGVVAQYVDVMDRWEIDAMRSPVVEFTRSSFNGKILRRGRAHGSGRR